MTARAEASSTGTDRTRGIPGDSPGPRTYFIGSVVDQSTDFASFSYAMPFG